MLRVGSWEGGGYGLSASHYVLGEIEGGHELTISGIANDYWRNEKQVTGKKLRMHVKFTSDLSRLEYERGILSGGQFFSEYVDIDLNIEPSQISEVLSELRLSDKRQLFVGGYAINPIIFRVTRFGLSEPRDYPA